jgi:hypothetical protein
MSRSECPTRQAIGRRCSQPRVPSLLPSRAPIKSTARIGYGTSTVARGMNRRLVVHLRRVRAPVTHSFALSVWRTQRVLADPTIFEVPLLHTKNYAAVDAALPLLAVL